MAGTRWLPVLLEWITAGTWLPWPHLDGNHSSSDGLGGGLFGELCNLCICYATSCHCLDLLLGSWPYQRILITWPHLVVYSCSEFQYLFIIQSWVLFPPVQSLEQTPIWQIWKEWEKLETNIAKATCMCTMYGQTKKCHPVILSWLHPRIHKEILNGNPKALLRSRSEFKRNGTHLWETREQNAVTLVASTKHLFHVLLQLLKHCEIKKEYSSFYLPKFWRKFDSLHVTLKMLIHLCIQPVLFHASLVTVWTLSSS